MEDRDFYRMTVEEALEALETSEDGLSRQEAEKRLEEYGENELVVAGRKSRLLMFLAQFKDLLVLVLLVAGIISYGIAIFNATQGDPWWTNFRDGSVMFFIVLLNAVIGFIQEHKASEIIESLRELVRSPADVVREGAAGEVPQRKLVPGDVVRVEAGDKIPADMRLIEAFNLRTSEFSLTGESMPQDKITNAIKEERGLADRDNMAYMGTTVSSGQAVGVVVRTGMDTELGGIATMTEEAERLKSPLQDELDGLALRLTGVVIVVSLALFGVFIWQGEGWLLAATYALGVAVACVPQALPAQLTVAMSTASRRLADKNAVVKSLPAVETLGATNTICTDKTGTLTRNEMTVRRAWFDGAYFTFTGTGYQPEGDILDEKGEPLSQEQIDEIEIMMDAATMASNAEVHEPDEDHDGWYAVGDPTEAALVAMSEKIGTRHPQEDVETPEVAEFPFESERKRMSSVREIDGEFFLAMKGGTDAVLSVSKKIYRDGKLVELTDEDIERIQEVKEEFSREALRVLALAWRPLGEEGRDWKEEEVEREVAFLGLVGMIDPPRDGVEEAIDECRLAHIDTFMITGDHATTAKAIGLEIGLARHEEGTQVIAGSELKEMSDEDLIEAMSDERGLVFSRVEPRDKLRIVKLLEDRMGKVVAVTGDGVNDAPALKRAHIGVAMGKTGTDVAKEAAQVVLLDDSFPTLVHAVEEGRTIYNNIRKVVLASLTTNTAELVAVLLGLVGMIMGNWAIPILAIQILAIDLLAEIMPLTFLCFDPPTEELMHEPPRRREEHILNWGSGTEVAFLGCLIGGLAVANFFLYGARHPEVKLLQGTVGTLPYFKASTMTWLTIAYCQFVNILSRRYRYTSIFNRNILTNRILFGSVVVSMALVLLGVYLPGLSDFLQFADLQLVDWLYVWGAAGIFLAVWETIKAVRRARRPGEAPA